MSLLYGITALSITGRVGAAIRYAPGGGVAW